MKKTVRIFIFLLCSFYFTLPFAIAQTVKTEVKKWNLFEVKIPNDNTYQNPFTDVELNVKIICPDGKVLNHFGFYDGNHTWKIRFSPDEIGNWRYKAHFSDNSISTEGIFKCTPSGEAGRIINDKNNPFWLSRCDTLNYLCRSFHVGDRFFAENWDDPNNPNDGNKRTLFLNWLQKNKYNMLSIASFFGNRDEKGRGQGWDTPQLWPLKITEFRKMEQILDTLQKRDIMVFPFAGFFGAKAEWPVNHTEQVVYIKYILARIGHYPNIIFNIAGPEPFYKVFRVPQAYQGAMRRADVNRLGRLIDSLDIYDHVLTLHRMKPASEFGDPFIDEPWCDMSTLQGPTTTDHEKLFSQLLMNHNRYKSQYAQETLWPGNKNHPAYTKTEIKRNFIAILFSGAVLNYADMEGNSSSGFSGTLDLNDVKPFKHEIAKEIWDWFQTIPFHQMTPRQDLVLSGGYCLADEGVEYYVFAPEGKSFQLFLDFPYKLQTEWISSANFKEIKKGLLVNSTTEFHPPKDGKDWILHVYLPNKGEVEVETPR